MNTTNLKNLALAIALTGISTVQAKASEPKKINVDQEQLVKLPLADQQRVLYIVDRLETIADMDRSELTRTERKALRNEVRSLKSETDAFNRAAGGTVVYISGAGLIIILLLLIILL